MDSFSIFILANLLISVVAIVVNDRVHARAYEEQRAHFGQMVQTMNIQLDAVQNSNTVLLARQEHFQTEIAGLLDANFALQRQNEQLRRDLEADAELKEMFGAG